MKSCHIEIKKQIKTIKAIKTQTTTIEMSAGHVKN